MKSFSELNISAPIMQAITDLGYEAPTPIQAETLPLLLGTETDFLGLAATGTGKTAAFAIPLLERIQKNVRGVQALILCPTRELAIQVAGQIDLLGKHIGIKSLSIYGGTGYSEQLYGLKNGATVVVGTPGRVVDHITKGTLKLDHLQTLILDEADEMISMGFKEDLEAVLESVPEDQANTWLFSATMGPEVRGVADTYLKNPKKVQVNRTEMVPETVEQIYYKTHEYDKPQVLCRIIDVAEAFYGIIFCQTKALVADLNQFLNERGYSVEALHGDLDQTSRDRVMKAFRERRVSILVATDVACRGLDVKDITHVVNYSIPRELENYVHRIGRTGRSGKQGLAMSLVTYSHRDLIRRIENMTKSRMREGIIPTFQEIAIKRLERVRNAFVEQKNTTTQELLTDTWKASLAEMSKEEITARFLGLLMPDLFAEKPQEKMSDSRPQQKERYAPRKESAAPRNYERRPDRSDRPDRAPERRNERPRFQQKFAHKKDSRPTHNEPAIQMPPNARWKKKYIAGTPRTAAASIPASPMGGSLPPKKKKYGQKKPEGAKPSPSV